VAWSQDLEALSPILSSLSLLGFFVFPTKDTPNFYVGRRIDLARMWLSYCPTLNTIGFPDRSVYRKIDDGNWEIERKLGSGGISVAQTSDYAIP
jgi:hypothetical protein